MYQSTKKLKNSIFILGSSSFLGYHFSKYLKFSNVFSFFKSKDYNGLKLKRFKNIKRKKIFFNFFYNNFKKIKVKPDIIINCLGDTKNYNSNFNNKKSRKIFFNLLKYINFHKDLLVIHSGSGSEKLKDSSYGKYKKFETLKLLKIKKNRIVILRIFSVFGIYNKQDNLFELIKKNKNNFKNLIYKPNKSFKIISIEDLVKIIEFIIIYKDNIKNNLVIDCCYSNKITPNDFFKKTFKINKNILNDKRITFKENLKNSIQIFLKIKKRIILNKVNFYLNSIKKN